MIKYLLTSLMFISVAHAADYHVAFYSDFEPISYSTDRDPQSKLFHEPNGYEIDLLKAIEMIPDSNMKFVFHGIKKWDGLWLIPSEDPSIDLAVGGITREDQRQKNTRGKKVVEVTRKTLSFKQSLLMTRENAKQVQNHEDLTLAYTVGAVRGTTGEIRFLAQTNMIDTIDSGKLVEGISVITHDKRVIKSDGNLSIYDPLIATRVGLIPQQASMPLVKYFTAEDSMIPSLNAGTIDAIARGFIGNKLLEERSHGAFAVTAIYSLECPKQESIACKRKEEAVFFVKKDKEELLNKLNAYIDHLTNGGAIDYDQWKENPTIFKERAFEYKT